MSEKNKIPKYIGPEISDSKTKMTREEIKTRFDMETASLYSQRNPLWLPDFEYSFALIARAIQPYMPAHAMVLDLGAGTGNLSRTVLEAYNDCRITLVDFSDNMLSEVPHVLSAFKGQYNIQVNDFFTMDYPEKQYNCVISSFAIHHGRSQDIYKHLYQNIYHCLAAPGAFICCDVIEGDNKGLTELNEEGWRNFLKNNFSDKEIVQILSNYHHEDSPLPLRKHLELLIQTGFSTADVLWKQYNFGIYMAIKE